MAVALFTGGITGSFITPVRAAEQPGMGGMGGGPGMGGMGGPPAGGQEEKKEGPAEEAPEDKEALRPIETVPAQPARRRRVQLFELDGYFRTRADFFHRLNLGLQTLGLEDGERPTKFFAPPAETSETDDDGSTLGTTMDVNDAGCSNRLTARGVSATRANTRCRRRNGFGSANMRLRLEPTLHITDSVEVHAQIDVFDNIVLGSTPDSYVGDNPWAPLDLFTRTQVPPTEQNTGRDSIVAKRAWGRIRFGFGLDVQFGRMPWSWGMGLVANHGMGYYRGEQSDIIRYVDQDYGDSVDSVRLAFDFGKDRRNTHRLAVSWDWAASGPTTAQLLGGEYASGGTIGQEFSIEQFDDVHQWHISLERRDEPDLLRRKISLGTPVVNYGIAAWVRYQDVDAAAQAYDRRNTLNTPAPDLTENARLGGLLGYANVLVHRRAVLATPSLWFRVNWRTLRVEFEAAGNFGRFRLEDLDVDLSGQADDYLERLAYDDPGFRNMIVLNGGYALEFKYGLFQDRFHIGVDHGLATGDTHRPYGDSTMSPLTQDDSGRAVPGDDRFLGNFRFNPAYNIDLLLFREVLGTVSNAAYFKPWAAFYFFDHFSVRADAEYALALRRAPTLGNQYSYGIELDGALRYHDAREPIFFQFQYGVLFPLGAFNRIRPEGAGREDARAVQTVQAQLGIRF